MSILKQFDHLIIPLNAIILATNNFAEDHCVGEGGFGKVYRGELLLLNRHTTVALKRLDRRFGQGDSEFWKEVIMLSLYTHENIVSLLGFCDERGEKILVYEYASKRGLHLYLDSNHLSWVQRLKICLGAARGLEFLHNPAGTQQRVLHRDIKSSNILLDDNWNAKIADLGLSRFGPANQQYTFVISNNLAGTFGYCDPLYIETGVLTKESDVYSFGVVLFEVLCGRLCVGSHDKPQSFIQLVRKCYKENNLNEIICGNIKDEIDPSSLKAFSEIALQCLKRHHEKRPLMSEIITGLEIALENQDGELKAGPSSQSLKLKGDNPLLRFKKICPPGGRNSVILYTSGLTAIRNDFEECSSVRSLLDSFKVVYEDRDLYNDVDLNEELRDYLGKYTKPPRLFIKGRYIGGAKKVLQLHAEGALQPLLAGIPQINTSNAPCKGCSGSQFVVCRNCSSNQKVDSGDEEIQHKCMECNENGLVKCPICQSLPFQ